MQVAVHAGHVVSTYVKEQLPLVLLQRLADATSSPADALRKSAPFVPLDAAT